MSETELFVARRTETRSRPIKKQQICFIDECQFLNFPHKVWLSEPVYFDTNNIVTSHRIISGDRLSFSRRSEVLISSGNRPDRL